MTTTELQARVDSFDYWYHHIKLTDEVTTPGFAPICMEAYRVPLDLTGLRILDVGTWDGYWAFEALKRGASEVVAIDDFSDDLTTDKSRRATAWEQFDLCRDVLGYGDRCRREECSLYDVTTDTFGSFDVVFFFGTLYHCRYPLLAMDRLSAICKKMILIESAICDLYSPYHVSKDDLESGPSEIYREGHIVMEFYPGSQYAGVATNWWVPTLQCLLGMTMSAGFPFARGWALTPNPESIAACRGFVLGLKQMPTMATDEKGEDNGNGTTSHHK